MYPDLFVGWLDFRFLRPASLESFPLLVISVIKHIINHHHHMWLVWSVSQARQGLEMYAQSHTVKEYHIIGWLVKSSSIYIKERERERERRKKTDCTCTWSGWDSCHWSFPGSCPFGWTRGGPSCKMVNQPLHIIYYIWCIILYYIMSILLNPCLSILPTFSALQTTVIPWSEMFPLFCECYSLYCSLNSKKIQDPCSPCLRVSSQNHWLCFPGRVKNCNIAQLENKFWRSPMDQKCSDTVASWVNYLHFFLQYSNISRNAFWKS